MRSPFVTIVDGSLPVTQYRTLKRLVSALGDERLRASYQTTFWYPFGTEPTNQVERAVLQLVRHVPSALLKSIRGVEWWLSRMRTSNVKVDFHRDRDNDRFDQTGKEFHPRISSVLYLGRCRGGVLAVTRAPPNVRNEACAPDTSDFDFVEPQDNRFTYFSGRLTHGVLDAQNQIPGRRLPREPSLRLAIAINFWTKVPWNVPRFLKTQHYRSLSLKTRHRLS